MENNKKNAKHKNKEKCCTDCDKTIKFNIKQVNNTTKYFIISPLILFTYSNFIYKKR
jgi:hypothetical protein